VANLGPFEILLLLFFVVPGIVVVWMVVRGNRSDD
jgi:hypothetical protein